MAYELTEGYLRIISSIAKYNHSDIDIEELKTTYKSIIYKSDLEDKYSEPMMLIGVYIAVASLYCILAMVVDLSHGLRRKKLWFPCKYFPINAWSLAVIAVAMKLPVDLSGNMPGNVDQAAKLGSLAFMCIMMANFLPCLATMGTTELLTNVTALGVLVITVVVNVCIQISTGVVGIPNKADFKDQIWYIFVRSDLKISDLHYTTIATIYVVLLGLLLIIFGCSSLAILGSKQIIESKYQQQHKAASKSIENDQLTVEKLQHHVRKYWIMAGSSSPQFIQACSPTTAVSGVICIITLTFHALVMGWAILEKIGNSENFDSDYKWSTLAILIVQFVGVIVGSVAPLTRSCFAPLSFKLTSESIYNHFKVFKVEKYWTQKLYDWKYRGISHPSRNHILKVFIKNLRNYLVLDSCILIQKQVVAVCKIIALIFFLLTQILRCLKWLIHAFCSSGESTETLEQSKFVLQLEENELTDSILKGLSKSFYQLIKNSEKKHPESLMKLITERSTKGFQGVRKVYDDNDQSDCWSLVVVTLTTIAATLPSVKTVEVRSLLKSVREGLEYVKLVEENLNASEDYESIQKAAKTLWEEVDSHHFHHTWLGLRLKDIASEGNTTPQIVQLFLEKAKTKIKDGETTHISICAHSMSCIAQTIIDDKESHEKLFDELSSRIADTMAACLTNLPQVIAMKAHTSVIEKREASVKAAARLLGETKEIIKTLQDPTRHVPCMDPDDLPFINKWRAYLSEP